MHRPPHRARTTRMKVCLAALSVGALIAAGGVAGATTDGFGLAAGASQHVTCDGPSLSWHQTDATSGDLSCAPNPSTDATLIPGNLLTVQQQSLESDPTGWDVPTTTQAHHDGSRALKVSTDESYISAPVTVTPGESLNLSAYAQSAGGDRLGLEVDFYRHGHYVGWDSVHKRGHDNPTVAQAFTRVGLDGITVPKGVDGAVIDLYGEHGDVYVDTIYLGQADSTPPTTTEPPGTTTDNPPDTTDTPPPTTTEPPPTTTQPPSNVVWQDNFDNGWGAWTPDTGCGWADGGEPESYDPDHATTANGIGTLTMTSGSSQSGCDYTSARMQTMQTHPVTLQTGQPLDITARIQMPEVSDSNGLWPAFWLWQTGPNDGYCTGDSCAEVDIVEWYGDHPEQSTSHLHGPQETEWEPNLGVDLGAGYHTYGMHWDGNNHITFTVDGVSSGARDATGFAGRSFGIILNLAGVTPQVDADHVGISHSTSLPATMNIDWVKVTNQ